VTWHRVATNGAVCGALTYPVESYRVVPPVCLGTKKNCSCLRHERVWGQWRCNSTNSQLRLQMVLSDYYLSIILVINHLNVQILVL